MNLINLTIKQAHDGLKKKEFSSKELTLAYLEQIKKTNKPVIVISSNEPQVVIISVDRFNQYTQAESKQNLWDIISSIQAKNKYNDPIATQKDIDEAVEEVRSKNWRKAFSDAWYQYSNQRPPISR